MEDYHTTNAPPIEERVKDTTEGDTTLTTEKDYNTIAEEDNSRVEGEYVLPNIQ